MLSPDDGFVTPGNSTYSDIQTTESVVNGAIAQQDSRIRSAFRVSELSGGVLDVDVCARG